MSIENFELIFLIILPLLAAIVTYLLIPPFKSKMLELNITGIDRHKLNKPRIPEMGGLVILIGFFCVTIPFFVISCFLYPEFIIILLLGITLLMVFLVGAIGIWDDIKRRNHDKKGVNQIIKVLLSIFIPIPLAILIYWIFIHVGIYGEIFFIITVKVGIFYGIILVPSIFSGLSNAVNLLGGFNGLEAGLGVIICISMGSFYIYNGLTIFPIILFCYGATLMAFLCYNRYPASIFPGDTMTYSFGALLACCVIIGDVIGTALLFGAITSGLWIIEFFIKLRTKFKGECFAKINPDGSLDVPDTGYSSLTHIAIKLIKKIKGSCHEKDVTFVFIIVQILLCIFAWILCIFI